MCKFRTLNAWEIECRVGQAKYDQQTGKSGVSLLLYKDARCDMSILDEAVGPLNWMRSHSRDNANCIVSIWDEKKQMWISKEDTGTESNTEAQKGLASDSFKRACVNWGIGRELYTAPFIWIPGDKCEVKPNGGRPKCYDDFEVEAIEYNERREIKFLRIINAKTRQQVYSWGKGAAPVESTKPHDFVMRSGKFAGMKLGDIYNANGGLMYLQQLMDSEAVAPALKVKIGAVLNG